MIWVPVLVEQAFVIIKDIRMTGVRRISLDRNRTRDERACLTQVRVRSQSSGSFSAIQLQALVRWSMSIVSLMPAAANRARWAAGMGFGCSACRWSIHSMQSRRGLPSFPRHTVVSRKAVRVTQATREKAEGHRSRSRRLTAHMR